MRDREESESQIEMSQMLEMGGRQLEQNKETRQLLKVERLYIEYKISREVHSRR